MTLNGVGNTIRNYQTRLHGLSFANLLFGASEVEDLRAVSQLLHQTATSSLQAHMSRIMLIPRTQEVPTPWCVPRFASLAAALQTASQ